MSAGFTPGPWHVCKVASGIMAILTRYPDGNPQRHVAHMSWADSEGGEPDAHLIAAAPELYAALEGFVAKIDPACLVENDLKERHLAGELRAALAALAKARGEA